MIGIREIYVAKYIRTILILQEIFTFGTLKQNHESGERPRYI